MTWFDNWRRDMDMALVDKVTMELDRCVRLVTA